MHKEVEKYLRLKRELIALEYARVFGSNLEAYKACGIPKSTFYDWKKAFEEEGRYSPSLVPVSAYSLVIPIYINSYFIG